MSKIYVVCRGSYSDRYVAAVFDKKENADEYMKIVGGECDTEEFEVNKTDIERNDVHCYRIFIENGVVKYADLSEDDYSKSRINTIKAARLSFSSSYLMYVLAKDSDHAKKIASDWFTMFKASKELNYKYVEEQIIASDYSRLTDYPLYDIVSGSIILRKSEHLIDGVYAKTIQLVSKY